jgi:hypothetical protein
MSAVPRIARAIPHGNITRPADGIPVVARLRWANGQDVDVVAVAIAWTREAVEVRWQNQDEFRTDWIPAGDVRRTMEEPEPDVSRPPSSRGQLRKNRW